MRLWLPPLSLWLPPLLNGMRVLPDASLRHAAVVPLPLNCKVVRYIMTSLGACLMSVITLAVLIAGAQEPPAGPAYCWGEHSTLAWAGHLQGTLVPHHQSAPMLSATHCRHMQVDGLRSGVPSAMARPTAPTCLLPFQMITSTQPLPPPLMCAPWTLLARHGAGVSHGASSCVAA